MRIATSEQMRLLDRTAIQERGVSSLDLMEQAALAVTQEVLELVGNRMPPTGREKAFYTPEAAGEVLGSRGETAAFRRGGLGRGPFRAALFCGPGNNGGDGVAAARFLLEEGWEVRVLLAGRRDRMTADTREMERRLMEAGGALEAFLPGDAAQLAWTMGADVVVDALFGIGLNTEVQGDQAAAVAAMNASGAPTVSVDIPSGVEADTGRILGTAVEAERTVTFTLPKAGLFVGKGGICSGRVVTADIGIPRDLTDALDCPVRSMGPGEVHLPRRARDAHKGDFGRVYILAGSVSYTGAPVLAAHGAVRSGAGLVTLGVPAQVWPIAAAKLNVAMPHPLPAGKEGMLSVEAVEIVLEKLKDCGVCLIGPGLGRSNGVASVIRHILSETRLSVVLDADGINALEGHIDVLDGRRDRVTVLTPHDGEFARLGGDLSHGDRLRAAREFAREHGCCLVLKGHGTITAFPDGTAYVNTTGNPGMAKGGSGDVLAGMIVALLGQGLSPREAVPAAVCLHGEAGDLCAAQLGEYSMTALDLAERLPEVMKEY